MNDQIDINEGILHKDISSSIEKKNTLNEKSPLKMELLKGSAGINSACGTQVDSRKKTAPNTKFGSSTRPHPTPQGATVPGPGAYQVPSAISKSVISTITNPPACSISGREKFGSTADLKEAAKLPGPGNYNSKIVNMKEKRAPQYSLGKKWTKVNHQKTAPGPASYTQPSSIGKTVLSTKNSMPATTFGKVKRKPLLQTSTADVGPGLYNTGNTAVGNQIESVHPNAAAYSFSVVGRKKAPVGTRMVHDVSPGPGTYKQKAAVGSQILSNLKSAPKCSMSGRVKFGSHF